MFSKDQPSVEKLQSEEDIKAVISWLKRGLALRVQVCERTIAKGPEQLAETDIGKRSATRRLTDKTLCSTAPCSAQP